jgi:osmotically inducible protein OsmC
MSNLMKPSKTLYTAHVTSIGGRAGRVTSDDGVLDLEVAMPPGLGGPGAKPNPEQLFAAGYAACFGSSVAFIAGQRKIKTESITIEAHVDVGPTDAGPFALAVKLVARVAGVSHDDAVALVDAAHAVCPYSNATRGNIEVTIEVA